MTTIYTLGYGNISLARLEALVEEHDADIWDIRWRPASRKPGFNRSELAATFGDWYRHVPELGNRNYKGGPMDIADYEAGRDEILAAPRSVILLCVCSDPADCHRTVVADRLRAEGHEVTELGGTRKTADPKPAVQKSFGFA